MPGFPAFSTLSPHPSEVPFHPPLLEISLKDLLKAFRTLQTPVSPPPERPDCRLPIGLTPCLAGDVILIA